MNISVTDSVSQANVTDDCVNLRGLNLSWITQSELNVSCHLNPRRDCPVFEAFCQDVLIPVNVFFFPILMFFGLVGNTLAFLVLRWDSLNHMVSLQLQALALIDNFYLLGCFFLISLKSLADCTLWSPWLSENYGFFEKYMWPFASTAQTSAVWLVTTITADRYLALSRPFGSKFLDSRRKVQKAIAFIIALAFIYNVPRFFEYQIRYKANFCLEQMQYRAMKSALRRNPTYITTYKVCCYFIFRVSIPFTILIGLNTSLIHKLRAKYRERTALINSQAVPRNDHFSILLVSMVTVFIICEIPDCLVRFTLAVNWRPFPTHYATTVTNMLLAINSSINCLIYCLVAQRFRKILKRLFCKNYQVRTYGSRKTFTSVNSMRTADTTNDIVKADNATSETIHLNPKSHINEFK